MMKTAVEFVLITLGSERLIEPFSQFEVEYPESELQDGVEICV